MTRLGRLALATGMLVSAAGCGDPLVSGSSLNEPTFKIEGAIAPYDPSRRMSIGVLWVDPALAGDAPSVSDNERMDTEVSSDGAFSLQIFGRPPKGAVKWLAADASSDAVALAWGELILYEDNDGNGTFRVNSLERDALIADPDNYAGVAERHVLLYVEEPAEEGTQIIGLARTLAAVGYVLGEAHCGDGAFVVAVEPNTVALRAVPATPRFPRVRQCFESIP